jgi:hypothetical protein
MANKKAKSDKGKGSKSGGKKAPNLSNVQVRPAAPGPRWFPQLARSPLATRHPPLR